MYQIKSKEEYELMVNAKRGEPVLVKFEAPWCEPCKALDLILDDVLQNSFRAVYGFKVDIDLIPDICAQLGVRTVPTLIVFENGVTIDRRIGVAKKEELVDWLNHV